MQLNVPAALKTVAPPRRWAWLALGLALLLGLSRGATVAHAGAALAWGDNGTGQLGDGTTTQHILPVPVKGVGGNGYLTGVKAVTMGYNHSLALLSNGTVVAWGDNYYGQLGDAQASGTQSLVPVQVLGVGGGAGTKLSGVTAIAAGYVHSLALLNDGTVVAWGSNYYGQLGNGTQNNSLVPVKVSGLGSGSGVTAIAAGYVHSLAVKSGGVVAWGYNGDGELGDGTTNDESVPVAVNTLGTLSGVTAVAAGADHSLALKSGGVVAWGYNYYGQLGDNQASGTQSNVPVAVNTLGSGSGVTAVAAGFYHSLALKSGGVVAWGSNGQGQLGDNQASGGQSNVPVAVRNASNTGPLTNISAIGTGNQANHSLAVQGTPTYVTLVSFDATRYSTVLWLTWRTGLETDNLGFNVYREVGGKKVRLNGNDLIAGSAIQTGNNSGCTYAWPDALVPGAKYWLEDVDLSGKSTWHGPITPRPGIGSAGAFRRSPVLGQ